MPAPAQSHFEYQIPQNFVEQRKVKEQAFARMKQLHGWCTDNKASVLMDLIFNHRPEVVVEVGIYGGKSLIPMAMALQYLKKGKIYGIDPWEASQSVVGFMDANSDWWGMLDHEQIMQDYLRKVREFDLEEFVRTLRTTSANSKPIYGIDLIHIDGNHSEDSAYFDVQKWIPLVNSGGFIVFDDVDWRTTDRAVEWLDENCIRITTFHEGNAWGIWMKK